MKYKKNKIHNYLLRASADTIFLKKIIKFNGVLDFKNNELDFFSFICKTIISQQISFKVANKIWEKIILVNQNKNENFLTFFEKKKNRTKILDQGVSKKKLLFIIPIFEALKANKVKENQLKNMNSENFRFEMKKFNGVGDWTCNMIEIFYFKKENIFPKNDLIINKMIQLINSKEKEPINFESRFDPYLSIISLHLWEIFPKNKLIN